MTQPEPLPKPTPETIKEAREAAGLSQKAAAQLVHSPHYQQWQRWELGAKMPLAAWELFLIKTGQRKLQP